MLGFQKVGSLKKKSGCACANNVCFEPGMAVQNNLSEIKPGDVVEILEISTPCMKFKTRLLDLGIRVGKEVTLVRNAPMGDPMHICVGNYDVTIRKSEAKFIKVTKK
ncbi:MAG: FeoA family protein [Fusobacteria bacterium]|nr:FeoA family protein [Fusobacteriota bacterium]